ncbi:EAL domain-containing protein [Methylobacterium sp. J-090]|uniref:EAL domain-containing protein n=1 Tax=Methylobacterium sp. J-090 TaxID=2836666 RepID=UPI001FB91070|nr:EAL domain-containing protein [Methylobacterium sp. J-090]MCJ2080573.1 EAL domain-containing protein [Methylobacterium sp. J-090]
MARIVGRRGGPWVLGVLGLGALVPLSVYAPLSGAFALATAAGAGALLAHRRAKVLAARCDKLSGEVDVLSQRLLRLESVTRLIAEQQVRANGAGPDAKAGADTAALAAGVEEVTAEIGLLSGIVRELAAVVAAQDGEIAGLKVVPVPPAPKPLPVAPEIVVVPRQGPPPAAPWTPRPLDVAARAVASREAAREGAILAAFDGIGLEVHLQPVVSLPQRKVISYEAVARLRVAGPGDLPSGDLLAPDAFLPILERHGRTTDLDRRMLQRTATVARHLAGRGSRAAVAYGLSPLSLFEPGFLRSLGRLVADEPELAGRLVVALPQTSWRSLDAEQAGALADLRDAIGFTLDRPVDLRLDPSALADRGVSQVKVPADMLLRPGTHQAMPDLALEDLVAALGRAGIQLVADRVERETDVPDLIDLNVPRAQGTVFAPARAVRAEVLAAPPPAPEPAPSAGDEPEPPPQRRPFRDFLRRAG